MRFQLARTIRLLGARWSNSAVHDERRRARNRSPRHAGHPCAGRMDRDGITYGGYSSLGTSFASPHVAGAAALLTDYNTHHPTADPLDHRGIKAINPNSARKRNISIPETLSAMSLDSAGPALSFDKDYLICGTSCTIANPGTAGLTQSWTPAAWSFDGTKLSVSKPLDDEQGVGFLDADRAIINLAGGNHDPGYVSGIGWDQSTISPADSPSTHTYALHQTLAAGSFLTATLTWDRVVSELDGNGTVNANDIYSLGELANLDLRVLNASNQTIAESVSTTDNVEHLHFPLPTGGHPDDYKLQVVYNGGGVLTTDYASRGGLIPHHLCRVITIWTAQSTSSTTMSGVQTSARALRPRR